MQKLMLLIIVQCLLLSGGQVLLKVALQKMGRFAWTCEFWWGLLTNWTLLLSGICCGGGFVLWTYLLRRYPFSTIYPMVSLSYVFGMLAAAYFFHETVNVYKWIGVTLIVSGSFLIVR